MNNIKKQFAQKLMDIKAIKLQPNEPFTWASGWKSPIYTDNRKTLGFADVRSFVKLELCHAIQAEFPEAEAVAGVATGAIAQGALVADELGLPYAYVRIGMVASFTYGFPVAEEAFREAGVRLVTLSDYNAVLEQAAETGYIKKEEIEVLNEWRKSPSTWKQND